MKRKFKAGLTSVSLPVFIADTSSTTGGGLSGVTSASSGLVLEYRRAGQSSWTNVTPVAGKTLGTYLSGGIVADGSLTGAYEVDFPDAAFASGARMVVCRIRGVTNMLPVLIEIELDAVDYQDATRFGLTAIPNVAQGSTGALATGNASGQVTVATLTAGAIQSIWDALTSGLLTAGSIGKWILDNLNATISSRASQSSVDQRPTLTQIEGSSILAKEATSASILTAIQNLNNLSAKINVFGSPLLEIPDTGSTVYAFTVVVKDDEDKLVSLDASPTVTAANATGTGRSGNLSAVSNPATGRYTFTYSVSDTHPAECLRISVSGAVSTEPRYIEWIGAVVNYDTLTVLQQISTDLAGKPNLAQIEGSAILAKESTVASRASQASVDGKPNLNQIEASTVLAKEQSVSSLLDRLGAFTGSGANTVLGFFRALMRKDAGVSTPSDVGGTYSNATDSLEAIRDRGDEAWITGSGGGGGGGIGTGARSVSITVTDQSATPIQSATVRVSRSGQTFAVQTNASGVALLSLDDATWTVSITTPGYSFAPVSLIVAGNVNQTYSMTQIAPTPPAPFAGLCNVQFSVIHLGLPVANATVVALLEDENPTVNNYLVSRQVTSGSTDLNGNCVLTLVQYAQFTRGGVYRIKVADSQGKTIHDRRVTIPSTSTANAEDLQDAR